MKKAYKSGREHWGSLRELKSGRYQASYVGPDGARHNAPATFPTKTQARSWLRERKTEIDSNSWVDPRLRTSTVFEAYALEWVNSRVSQGGERLRENTKMQYRERITRGLAPFATTRVASITTQMVRKWHAQRSEQATTAAGTEARLLHSILNTAVHDRITDRNPVSPELTRVNTGVFHRIPTMQEMDALLDSMRRISPQLELALAFAGYCALRLSEWRALTRADLMPQDGRYYVAVTRQVYHDRSDRRRMIVAPPKTSHGVRMVPAPMHLNSLIEEHLENFVGPSDSALIFSGFASKEFVTDTHFIYRWNKVREEVGVRYRADADDPKSAWVNEIRGHDLRAYAATGYSQGGATMKETMDFLGQVSLQAAMLYQHNTGRAADLVDRIPVSRNLS